MASVSITASYNNSDFSEENLATDQQFKYFRTAFYSSDDYSNFYIMNQFYK